MSVTVLTYTEIDRMFAEVLRRKCVTAGYIPDVKLFLANPSGYEAAKAALRTSLGANGRLIDTYPPGPWDAREDKDVCKIVIDRVSTSPGTIGGWAATSFTQTSGSDADAIFRKDNYPDNSTNLSYEVRVVSDRIDVGRIAEDIVVSTLGHRRYIKTVDANGTDTANSVLVKFLGSVDVSDERYYEKVYKYEVCDVFVEPMVTVQSGIPALQEVIVETYLEEATANPHTPTTTPVTDTYTEPAE